MPNALPVDPEYLSRRGEVPSARIRVRSYDRPFAAERERLGDERLRRILRHMLIVREFETMLGSLKTQGSYRGTAYQYVGPAHLSIGQEAAAVGAAFGLQRDDQIFGSHRSHGEFIAKGLSAVSAADPAWLISMMESHEDARLLKVLEGHLKADDEWTRATQFLLLGLLAEIFGRANGFNRGMGGSMHAFFTPLGIYPNNAIVGGSAGIATGAALFQKLHGDGGIAVANIGDGATGCGPVWEAMNFASMGQFDRLWDTEHRGHPPVLFCFHNNFYAMGGQTIGETSGYDRLSRIGSAFNPQALHAETVDGNNPLAVADAVVRKRELLRGGDGPALLDIECYRSVGHSTTDGNVYRTPDELAAWKALDPIETYAELVTKHGLMTEPAVEALREETARLIGDILGLAADETASPRNDPRQAPLLVGGLMFADTVPDVPAELAEPRGVLTGDPQTNPRVRQLAKRTRFGIAEDGTRLRGRSTVTIRDTLFEAILHHFQHDETLVAYGEECREWGGAFGVYRGLSDLLPYHRLFNAPISEAAIIATAVGYGLAGGRALVELMYADFIGRAGDELFNQLGKWQAMSGGVLRMPVVVRTSVGSKYGAQHSQDWTSLVAHIPGLKVAYPATPYDAKGLLASALSGDDPVVFFESQRLYEMTELFHTAGVPTEYYRIPLGEPDIKRAGRDLTILTIGPSLYPAVAAADTLAGYGISAEVIDARSLVPFDYGPVLDSVRRTHRIVLVSESCGRASMLHTMAHTIQTEAFADLAAPVQCLTAPNWIVPSAELESSYFPKEADILDVVNAEFLPIPEYVPSGHLRADRLDLSARGL